MTELFIYDGAEVIKTGREATKERPKRGFSTQVFDTLVEIKSTDETGWTKWVKATDLYEVKAITEMLREDL